MKTLKFTISLELTREEQKQITQNSIERVMNNAITCGESYDGDNEILLESNDILVQNCKELKPITRKLWEAVREAIIVHNIS